MFDVTDWRFFRWNKAFSQVSGYSDDELSDMRPRQLIPELDQERLLKMQDIFLATGNVSFEMNVVSKNGNITPYLLSGNLLHYDGKPYVVGMGIDVTERKKSENALKEAEFKFRTIFDHASDGLLLARSSDKMFIEANEKICRMLGYSKEELLQLSISDIHPKDSISNVIEQFIRLQKKEISIVHDLPVIMKDKSIFFADVSASTIDYNGMECLLGIFRDVTDRKKAEEELKESRESYRKLFEDHAAVKLIIDPQNSKILDANHAACQYYGWTRKKMQQMKISDINTLTPDEIENGMKIAQNSKKFHFEFKHRLANGSIRDVEVYSSLIEMNGKNVLHSVIHDITERKKAETDLLISEERFKSIVSTSQEWIWAIDTNGIHTFSNDAVKNILGYTHKEILNLGTPGNFLHEEDLPL
jgi:PAS domain S-box-containing protein